ncbi:MAG: phytanoyl-CoA dioxygenase family protein [Pseudomonadota bacterium]|nr:phytanoyl-CoA dioxygenase family protein [Pseudomonadota bacterium]MEE3182976.1 phytanoyl-CoA dioxygenase family protein [Pseudomonadota bacterium]
MSTTLRAIEEIEDVGYTIIPDIISQSRLFEAQQDAEKLLHTIPAKGLNGTNIDGRMCKGLFAKTREFDDIAANSTIMAIVNGILHPDSRPVYYGPKRGAQLGSAMIKDVQPGEDIRALHRDDNYPLPHPHPPLIVNSLLALDPFNDETGGTWVVPRSHTWSGDVSSTTEHVTVTMDPGSIVLFNGALWHGRGPNYTPDQTRRALNLLYNCSWLRPWEGEHLGIPENEWNSLPPAVKAIL